METAGRAVICTDRPFIASKTRGFLITPILPFVPANLKRGKK